MSAYYQNYVYDPEVLLPARNNFGFPQSNPPRSKTPTSLVNHTGLTPTPSGPIGTPRSRNNSLPPEQMNWQDEPESLSTSPTSVRTPDNDAFEQELFDEAMRDVYQNQNGDLLTQVSQGTVDGMDLSYEFSEQDMQNVFMAAAFNTVTQQFNAAPFNDQVHQQQLAQNNVSQVNQMNAQSFNQYYAPSYTRQPPQQDPWNAQRPPRGPDMPRSGAAVFDPETDRVDDYSRYVNDWQTNSTDPNYLVSPNTPAGPPFDQYLYDSQISPVEMQVTLSAVPFDHNSAFNQTSSLFTDAFLQEPIEYHSPGVNSTSAQAGLSPLQGPVSPLQSVPSPSSDGVYSYQNSDSGMVLDTFQSEQVDVKPQPPGSSVQIRHPTPFAASPVENIFDQDPDPEPEPEPEPQRRRSQPQNRGLGGRPGGRALGTHLEPKVAKAAHDMRKIVACWHCVLQRDKCGPGDICERCLKRSQRPNSDCGLGCSRVKLIELSAYFLPTLCTSIHEDAQLTHFVSQHIHQWGNVEITLYMTCGAKNLPRVPVKVYEFTPKTRELLRQFQYKTDPLTYKRYREEKQSPPVGMVHINHNEEKKYDKYVNDIVENHLDAFGELCWMEDDNDFQQKLFRLMTRVKPKSDDEAKLLHSIFRLIVIAFIMGHTLTIAEQTKINSLKQLHSYTSPHQYVTNFCSPRMTNRQLKYFFHRLHTQTLATVLNKLQQIFKSSKGCDKWVSAFIAVLGLAMACEDQQKTIHLVMETTAITNNGVQIQTSEHETELRMREGQVRADHACRDIDGRFGFISQIFRWKYNRKCNPLRDAELEWDREVGFGDASSVSFVRNVANLVKENIDFLSQRQNVSISTANQTKYTARLVGQFLLSFWLPS